MCFMYLWLSFFEIFGLINKVFSEKYIQKGFVLKPLKYSSVINAMPTNSPMSTDALIEDELTTNKGKKGNNFKALKTLVISQWETFSLHYKQIYVDVMT